MDDARDPNHPNPGIPRPEAPDDRSAGLEAELAAARDESRQANDGCCASGPTSRT